LNFLLFPDLIKRFADEALRRTQESGYYNPSSYALIRDVLTAALHPFNLVPNDVLPGIIYLVFAAAFLLKSWRAWALSKAARGDSQNARSLLIYFSILVYTIAMPRMKDYAYMLAIPSVLFALESFEIKTPRWLMFLPLVLLVPRESVEEPRLFSWVFATLWKYYPLFVALFFWRVYMQELKLEKCAEPKTPA
jgi:hypothetical protein